MNQLIRISKIPHLVVLMSTLLVVSVTSVNGAPVNTDPSAKIWTEAVSISQNSEELELQQRLSPDVLVARGLYLNQAALKQQLLKDASKAARSTGESVHNSINIPLPQGGQVTVSLEPSAVMAPELAKQFPEIQTWRVKGLNDENIHGRVDITKHGFHAMLIMADGDTVYVEPDKKFENNKYLSFSKRSNVNSFKTDFKCGVKHDNSSSVPKSTLLKRDLARPANKLARLANKKILYRLAVAATGEYTQYHGGSKSDALSAIVTTINRVNEIYERDLGVTFQLVAEELDIIYTNPFSDPYTNSDIDALIDENLFNLSSNGSLSRSRYDIGHLFSAGDVSGLSAVGSACDSTAKAMGVTGIEDPIGDAFNVDFVAHEIGHQLGGTHTFNSFCGGSSQRNPETAVEPGSGSTIMSYAGVCGYNNLQEHAAPQFHAVSISQISEFVREGGGSSCGFSQNTSNQNPTVSAGSDYSIPTSTAFTLKASGSDSDGDSLSYTWEQIDTGSATDKNVDAGDNALFRSRLASSSKIRTIPRLKELFNNAPVDGEYLPTNERSATFITTVRDGKGGVATDKMVLDFVETSGGFEVTSHRSGRTLSEGEKTTVNWTVAGTDKNPIDCQDVEISLIEDDGFKQSLITTDNDGSAQVELAGDIISMKRARFMVACTNRPFFALSQRNLKIEGQAREGDSEGGSLIYILLPLALVGFYRRRKGK